MVWVCLALVLAGVAIAYLFATSIEQRMREDLGATLNRLIAIVDPAEFPAALTRPLDDPRYETPFGGRYWEVEQLADNARARSRSLWDYRLELPVEELADGSPHYLRLAGPDQQSLTVLARIVRYRAQPDAGAYLFVVAEDRVQIVRSLAAFRLDLAIALAVLGMALIGAAWLQVELGLRPLKAIRAGIEKVRSGADSRLTGAFPSEMEPLIGEVNDLLRLQETSIEFARARAADLAHGLKTPLSVLGTTAAALRAKGDAETGALIDDLSREMTDRISYQLRLSRLRIRTRAQVYRASVEECLKRTIAVLQRTQAGERLNWQMVIDDHLLADLDTHDLIELFGVILENATKWAHSLVTIRASRDGDRVTVRIEDDGPGLPEGARASLGTRGHKLDEAQPGSGLGLSIAMEIIRLNSGSIDFRPGETGGLAVIISLPQVAETPGSGGKA